MQTRASKWNKCWKQTLIHIGTEKKDCVSRSSQRKKRQTTKQSTWEGSCTGHQPWCEDLRLVGQSRQLQWRCLEAETSSDGQMHTYRPSLSTVPVSQSQRHSPWRLLSLSQLTCPFFTFLTYVLPYVLISLSISAYLISTVQLYPKCLYWFFNFAYKKGERPLVLRFFLMEIREWKQEGDR